MGLGVTISDEALTVAVSLVLVLALISALVASKRRTGLLITPVTFFFLFASCHAFFARYAASFLAGRYDFVGPATLEPFLSQSFLIISAGLTSCLLAYTLIPSRKASRVVAALKRISSEEAFRKVCARSRSLILLSIPLIVIGLQSLGGIPLLSDNPRQERYLLNFTPEHRLDNFLVNRGREILVVPTAVLALAWYWRKRRLIDAGFVMLAAAGALLTATRSPLMIAMLVVMTVLVWRRRVKTLLVAGSLAVAGLVVSEIALGADSNVGSAEWTMTDRFGADVTEVRDLAWTLVKHDGNYWGATFVAGFVPVPAFASEFAQTYHLRTVTLSAIGIPVTAAHGGLRITYSGEWFLNFGWPGVVFGGILYGWISSWFSAAFYRLACLKQPYPVGALMLSCAWVMVSFTLYIVGSEAGGTLKTYAAVLAVLLFRLRATSPAPTGSAIGRLRSLDAEPVRR